MAAVAEQPDEVRLELEPGVVGADRDACHRPDPTWARASTPRVPSVTLDPRTPVHRRRRPVPPPRRRRRRRPRAGRADGGGRSSRRPPATPGSTAPPDVDSIRVVSSLSWRYRNPAWVLAERLGHRRPRAGVHVGRRQHAADARQPDVARDPARRARRRPSSSAARRGAPGCGPAATGRDPRLGEGAGGRSRR